MSLPPHLQVFPLLQQLLLLQQHGTHSAALNLLLVLLLLVQVWDNDYYEEKAKEKASLLGVESFLDLLPKPREKPKPPPLPPCGYRQQLQQRTFKLDFEREASRTKMVTLQSPRMQQGGYVLLLLLLLLLLRLLLRELLLPLLLLVGACQC